MKKTILAVACCLSTYHFAATAQEGRLMRADEIAFYNNIHEVLYSALPHVYKNWKVVEDGKAFDAKKYFCPLPEDGCYGKIPVSIGKGDPYSLNYFADFTMPGDESAALMVEGFKIIKDYNNANEIALALKTAAKSKVNLRVFCNIDGGQYYITYCPKTPPETIKLPVQATLALKGVRASACPIMSGGRPDMAGNYYDNAVIFLGKPIAKKEQDERSDGINGTIYYIGFDNSKISKLVTQNIIVQITGDSGDIDAIVKLIDWQKLYNAIGK